MEEMNKSFKETQENQRKNNQTGDATVPVSRVTHWTMECSKDWEGLQ